MNQYTMNETITTEKRVLFRSRWKWSNAMDEWRRLPGGEIQTLGSWKKETKLKVHGSLLISSPAFSGPALSAPEYVDYNDSAVTWAVLTGRQ